MPNLATVNPDGTGVLTIAGHEPAHVSTTSVEDTRRELLGLAVDHARRTGQQVSLTARDPQAEHQLIVLPNGTVQQAASEATPAPATPPPAPARRRRRQTQTSGLAYEHGGSFLTDARLTTPTPSGWRALLARLGFKPRPSDEDVARWDDQRAIAQHWDGPRTIAVLNGKGGAGKTPATALLAGMFARAGGAGVLAWDSNVTRGTLGWRTESGPHSATVLDLLPRTEQLMQPSARAADLAGVVHHQTGDRYDVLRSNPLLLSTDQKLTPSELDDVHTVLAKYYRLILMDSGNDEGDALWLRMIDHADQIVVATTTRPDHAEAGRLLLNALADRDEHSARLAQQAIVIVSQADRDEAAAGAIAHGFTTLARAVVTIPYDPAIRAQWLRVDNLAPRTHRAYLRAAAEVAAGL